MRISLIKRSLVLVLAAMLLAPAPLLADDRIPDAVQTLFRSAPQGPDTKSRKQPHAK